MRYETFQKVALGVAFLLLASPLVYAALVLGQVILFEPRQYP